MLCILSLEQWPAFNFACEEHFLKYFTEDVFFIYRNSPSVVVGKHQNSLAEIDYRFMRSEQIGLYRRISGGGAVYHDPGNVNFSFLCHSTSEGMVDFARFTLPIRNLLGSMGLQVSVEGKSNLAIEGKKISGNAEHLFKNKVLHHGTLLFSTDLRKLQGVLSPSPGVFRHKGMPSEPRHVTNIGHHLEQKMSVKEFEQTLFNYIKGQYEESRVYNLNREEVTKISELAYNKYETYQWNYGYSPSYRFSKVLTSPEGEVLEIVLNVSKGLITRASFFGNYTRGKDPEHLALMFRGIPHTEEAIREKVSKALLNAYMPRISPQLFYECII